MTDPRVICIKGIRFDYLAARVEGIAICRSANGVLSRLRLSVPSDLTLTRSQAVRALTRRIGAA